MNNGLFLGGAPSDALKMLIPGANTYLPEHHFAVGAKCYEPSSPACKDGGDIVFKLRARQQGVVEAGSGKSWAGGIEDESKLLMAIPPLSDHVIRQVVNAA